MPGISTRPAGDLYELYGLRGNARLDQWFCLAWFSLQEGSLNTRMQDLTLPVADSGG